MSMSGRKMGGPEMAINETTVNHFRVEEEASGDVQVPADDSSVGSR
jgi:hypothetical protein